MKRRGGARPGAGRKPGSKQPGGVKVAVSIYLLEDLRNILTEAAKHEGKTRSEIISELIENKYTSNQ